MNTLQSAVPCGALRHLVRAYAQRTTGATEIPVMQRVPASLEVVIGFEFGSLFTVDYRDGSSEPAHRIALVGSHCSPNATLSMGAGVESFAIFLQPTALQRLLGIRLLGIPTHHVADRSYPAVDVLGSRVDALWSVLADAASFEQRVRLCEIHLLRMLRDTEPTTIAHVAMDTFRGHGRLNVAQMAGLASLSIRQFERQFERELGMPPKRFARIARFSSPSTPSSSTRVGRGSTSPTVPATTTRCTWCATSTVSAGRAPPSSWLSWGTPARQRSPDRTHRTERQSHRVTGGLDRSCVTGG